MTIENNTTGAEKNVLTVLLTAVLTFSLVTGIVMYYMLTRQYRIFYRVVAITGLIAVFLAVLLISITIFLIFLVNHGKGDAFRAGRLLRKSLDMVVFPVMGAGRVIGIDRETIQRAYAQLNNRIIYSGKLSFNPREVLLLLPHCIQDNDCKHKITGNIKNCGKCGKCPVSSIVELGERYGVEIEVVPGGTLARKVIEEKKPKAVVAVACENDLCSGIHDARLIPVVGILNERPQGPCFNTTVDVKKIERAVRHLCYGRDV